MTEQFNNMDRTRRSTAIRASQKNSQQLKMPSSSMQIDKEDPAAKSPQIQKNSKKMLKNREIASKALDNPNMGGCCSGSQKDCAIF